MTEFSTRLCAQGTSRAFEGRRRWSELVGSPKTSDNTHLVHIVDDDVEVRHSTAVLLGAFGYRTQTWTGGKAFLRAAPAIGPSCVLLDLAMPEMSGLEVQSQLIARSIRLPLIFMTGAAEVGSAVSAMRSGAIHFLEKPFAASELMFALEEGFCALGEPDARVSLARGKISCLTRREREVLSGLVAGLPNKSIAFDLGISPRTIEEHRDSIIRKFGAINFAQPLRIAFEAGM